MTNEQTRVYFLSKYALSRGIEMVDGVPDARFGRDYVRVPEKNGRAYTVGKDLFLSLPEAIADAEMRRQRRLASLRKLISKLEKMTFEGKND